jgi:hypothetical protein
MISFREFTYTIMSPFKLPLRLRSLAAAFLISLAFVRPAAAVDLTDIWWNPNESGWGVNFIQSDNFIFATFFIYGSNQQPFWVTAQLTRDSNGVWSGPLYQTTGTFYGSPWNAAQQTTTQVGTATFTQANSYSGTLTYNVGTTNVSKQIQRQTLKAIPAGGSYAGSVLSIFSNCNDATQNGPYNYFVFLTVTQTIGGPLQFDFSGSGITLNYRITGNYVQNGQLYRIPNAAYTVNTFTFTAQVFEIKPTSQGIEGRWTAPVGAAFPGCVEDGYFSALFLS